MGRIPSNVLFFDFIDMMESLLMGLGGSFILGCEVEGANYTYRLWSCQSSKLGRGGYFEPSLDLMTRFLFCRRLFCQIFLERNDFYNHRANFFVL